jgi:hypothetical protein
MKNKLTNDERLILQEAARIKRNLRHNLNEMPKGIARDPSKDLRNTSIVDLRSKAADLGIDVSRLGKNKRAILQAIEDAEENPKRTPVVDDTPSFSKTEQEKQELRDSWPSATNEEINTLFVLKTFMIDKFKTFIQKHGKIQGEEKDVIWFSYPPNPFIESIKVVFNTSSERFRPFIIQIYGLKIDGSRDWLDPELFPDTKELSFYLHVLHHDLKDTTVQRSIYLLKAAWAKIEERLKKALDTTTLSTTSKQKEIETPTSRNEKQTVKSDDVCSYVNSFMKRVSDSVSQRCTMLSPGKFQADFRSWKLSKESYYDEEDEFEQFDREETEGEIISSWEVQLQNFLKENMGDIFSNIELYRGDKNYVEVFVSTKPNITLV